MLSNDHVIKRFCPEAFFTNLVSKIVEVIRYS